MVVAFAAALWPATQVSAQKDTTTPSAAAAPKMSPDGKKILTLADYPSWKRINGAALSDDGKWMTYTYAPNDGDETMYIKQLDGDTLYTVPMGSAAAAVVPVAVVAGAAVAAAGPCSFRMTAIGSRTT